MLSLFLDSEDVDDDLTEFFRSTEGVITGAQIAEQVEIPERVSDGSRDLYRTVRMCQRLEELLTRRDALVARTTGTGVLA